MGWILDFACLSGLILCLSQRAGIWLGPHLVLSEVHGRRVCDHKTGGSGYTLQQGDLGFHGCLAPLGNLM